MPDCVPITATLPWPKLTLPVPETVTPPLRLIEPPAAAADRSLAIHEIGNRADAGKALPPDIVRVVPTVCVSPRLL